MSTRVETPRPGEISWYLSDCETPCTMLQAHFCACRHRQADVVGRSPRRSA
jgi:hypothetical protein